jgi:hypothetical protein
MRVYLTRAEQQAIHLARMQYEQSATKYAEKFGHQNGTAIEHDKLARTLAHVLGKAGFYPPPVTR